MICVDSLFNFIDGRIDKHLANTLYINAIPCSVSEVLSNGLVKVKAISNGAVYTVPNHCGSAVGVGENVQLFYRGNMLSNKTGYIGAALYKPEGSGTMSYIGGSKSAGGLLPVERIVSKIDFKNNGDSVIVGFNATIYGDNQTKGNGSIKVYLDGELQDFVSKFTVGSGDYETISFTLPMSPNKESHTITFMGVGENASLSDIASYVYGAVEETTPSYDPTSESDYIYYVTDNKTNIAYYIGQSQYPEIPITLNNVAVDKLDCTSFNYANVKAVYIPDGVTEIE